MILEATRDLLSLKDLSSGQMTEVMKEIMTGSVDTAGIVSFLNALSNKGETIEEITAAANVMRSYATKISATGNIILDTCGTGGDTKGTFNISTVVAFVAGGCGITVAKHGNRSISSCCGSADILEALGVNINMPPEQLQQCLKDAGVAFLFAQNLHPAMKYAMPARKEIGKRTIFNILGPLSNPAGARHQLMGVYDKRWLGILASVLRNLGSEHALVVHGADGLDEITTVSATFISELYNGEILNYEIKPEDFGMARVKPEDLKGGLISDNVSILMDILNGKKGPKRDVVVLNSAAAIYAADKVRSIKEGIALAEESIDSKKALYKLEQLKGFSR